MTNRLANPFSEKTPLRPKIELSKDTHIIKIHYHVHEYKIILIDKINCK